MSEDSWDEKHEAHESQALECLSCRCTTEQDRTALLAEAQVYATLALAAATRAGSEDVAAEIRSR